MNGRNSENEKGRGLGNGQGKGLGNGRGRRQGSGRGRGYSENSYCECAKCGTKTPHEQGKKCTDLKCPNCGNTMVNELLLHK